VKLIELIASIATNKGSLKSASNGKPSFREEVEKAKRHEVLTKGAQLGYLGMFCTIVLYCVVCQSNFEVADKND